MEYQKEILTEILTKTEEVATPLLESMLETYEPENVGEMCKITITESRECLWCGRSDCPFPDTDWIYTYHVSRGD